MRFRRRERKNLLDGLTVDAPYVTEIRRLLQGLYRQQKGDRDGAHVYMVTSAGTGEGKSTICTLMAIVSARVFHKRTLLIDADLRRPTVHSLIGVTRAPGLFEIMRRTSTIRDASRPTALPLLTVIPSGDPRGAVSESYDDEEFAKVLGQLRTSYDLVFVDSPPGVPTIEPLLMAEHVDSILLVAMAGQTATAIARRLMQILSPVSSKIVGVILNNAVDGLPYYYDYRYYGYGKTEPSRIRRTEPRPKPEQSAQPRVTRMGGEG